MNAGFSISRDGKERRIVEKCSWRDHSVPSVGIKISGAFGFPLREMTGKLISWFQVKRETRKGGSGKAISGGKSGELP